MKLITGYIDYSSDDLFHLGSIVPPNITGKDVFALLKPTPAEITAATDALKAAMEMVGPGRKEALAATHLALAKLLAEVAVNASQLPGITDTDLAQIGLPIVKTPTRETEPPPAPQDLRLRHGEMPGKNKGSCKPPGKNIRGYASQWTLDPNGGAWNEGPRFSSSRDFKWTGLERGKDTWFRVAAINSVGQGPWSDPGTIMVI